MEPAARYVGLAVAKAPLDVAVRPTNDRWASPHTEAGSRQLVARLQALAPGIVVLEASGGLEPPLVAALASATVLVVVGTPPRQVRDFARATGQRAYLPERGTLDRRQVAALVGVAPFSRDSGTWRGRRGTWGGHARVRAALYRGALVAARHNPVIRVCYQRLLALTACMRKLLVILNAMLKHGSPWCEVSPQVAGHSA